MTQGRCTILNKSARKFYREDFESHFCIRYLEHSIIKDPRLKNWDICNDKEYTINPDLNDRLEERYGPLINEGYTAKICIRWINKKVSYGAFAEQDIERGEMVCEYTGIVELEEKGDDNLYLWDYPTVLKEKNKRIRFCVNAEKAGNYARFINHSLRKYQNVGIQMIPSRNLWHVVYIAQKDIKKGEQLLTYYGMQYWRDRKIVPTPLTPWI